MVRIWPTLPLRLELYSKGAQALENHQVVGKGGSGLKEIREGTKVFIELPQGKGGQSFFLILQRHCGTTIRFLFESYGRSSFIFVYNIPKISIF